MYENNDFRKDVVFTFYYVLRYVARNGLSVHKDLDVSFLQHCRAPNPSILFQKLKYSLID